MSAISCEFHDSLASTSDHLRGLVERGHELPFATAAEHQSQGRGQRHKHWESPRGNLYVSLALKVPPADLPKYSIVAGVVVAKWLRSRFGIRPTLKWPNDLLWGGCKLGGLLCEAMSQEGATVVIVGLGINLRPLSEDMLGTLSQKAISIEEILPRADKSLDPGPLVEELLSSWQNLEQVVLAQGVNEAYQEFAIEAGQIWHGQGRSYRQVGFGLQGQLIVKDLQSDEETEHHSADHTLRWRYLRDEATPVGLMIADQGNSTTDFSYYATADARHPTLRSSVPHEQLCQATVASFLAQTNGVPVLHLASVDEPAADKLCELVGQLPLSIAQIPKRPLRRMDSAYPLHQLGIDRLAAIESWLALTRPSGASEIGVLICAGTCTTVDFVSDDGRHLGGWIGPGLGMMLQAMTNQTSGLPEVALPPSGRLSSRWPASTEEAMGGAVQTMTVSWIKSLLDECIDDLSLASVVVTGGWGQWLATQLPARHDPNLILNGLRLMVVGGGSLVGQ